MLTVLATLLSLEKEIDGVSVSTEAALDACIED